MQDFSHQQSVCCLLNETRQPVTSANVKIRSLNFQVRVTVRVTPKQFKDRLLEVGETLEVGFGLTQARKTGLLSHHNQRFMNSSVIFFFQFDSLVENLSIHVQSSWNRIPNILNFNCLIIFLFEDGPDLISLVESQAYGPFWSSSSVQIATFQNHHQKQRGHLGR